MTASQDNKKDTCLLKKTSTKMVTNCNQLEGQLYSKGMTPDKVAEMLMELCNWKTIKIDKNGNVHESVDGQLRLHALGLWAKVTGAFKSKEGDLHQHLHLQNVTEAKLDDLARKAK